MKTQVQSHLRQGIDHLLCAWGKHKEDLHDHAPPAGQMATWFMDRARGLTLSESKHADLDREATLCEVLGTVFDFRVDLYELRDALNKLREKQV